MSKSFRVKVGVRNNALLECIERAGYRVGSTFCNAAGVSYQSVWALVTMRVSPMKGDAWRPIVLRLADFLNAAPEQMFHTEHLTPIIKPNVERKVDAQEVYDMLLATEQGDPLLAIEHKELADAVSNVLNTLTAREREIIERRTMGGETHEEIGASFNLTRERVRQIEAKALRRLRGQSRSKQLREFFMAGAPAKGI